MYALLGRPRQHLTEVPFALCVHILAVHVLTRLVIAPPVLVTLHCIFKAISVSMLQAVYQELMLIQQQMFVKNVCHHVFLAFP